MARDRVVNLPLDCERARRSSSLRLDGELSDLEARLLERHLGACPACCEYDGRVEAVTLLVRSAEPEEPSGVLELELPARRAPFSRARPVAVLVAASLALGSVVGSLGRPSEPQPERSPSASLLALDVSQLRKLPRGNSSVLWRVGPTPPPGHAI